MFNGQRRQSAMMAVWIFGLVGFSACALTSNSNKNGIQQICGSSSKVDVNVVPTLALGDRVAEAAGDTIKSLLGNKLGSSLNGKEKEDIAKKATEAGADQARKEGKNPTEMDLKELEKRILEALTESKCQQTVFNKDVNFNTNTGTQTSIGTQTENRNTYNTYSVNNPNPVQAPSSVPKRRATSSSNGSGVPVVPPDINADKARHLIRDAIINIEAKDYQKAIKTLIYTLQISPKAITSESTEEDIDETFGTASLWLAVAYAQTNQCNLAKSSLNKIRFVDDNPPIVPVTSSITHMAEACYEELKKVLETDSNCKATYCSLPRFQSR